VLAAKDGEGVKARRLGFISNFGSRIIIWKAIDEGMVYVDLASVLWTFVSFGQVTSNVSEWQPICPNCIGFALME